MLNEDTFTKSVSLTVWARAGLSGLRKAQIYNLTGLDMRPLELKQNKNKNKEQLTCPFVLYIPASASPGCYTLKQASSQGSVCYGESFAFHPRITALIFKLLHPVT